MCCLSTPPNTIIRSPCSLTDNISLSFVDYFYPAPSALLFHLAKPTPQSTIQRHRHVYATLAKQLAPGLHAHQIKAETPAEVEAAVVTTPHVMCKDAYVVNTRWWVYSNQWWLDESESEFV